MKEETKAKSRVMADEECRWSEPATECLKGGKASTAEALWAKAY